MLFSDRVHIIIIIIIFILYRATSIIVRGASQHITIKQNKKIYVHNVF